MIAITGGIGIALLNTVIGMGTVFIVLIFISFIISLFKHIGDGNNKKTTPVPVIKPQESVVSKAVEMEETEEIEELSDDLELVAIITAAIAAYQGSTSAEGFQVRSIKRATGRR